MNYLSKLAGIVAGAAIVAACAPPALESEGRGGTTSRAVAGAWTPPSVTVSAAYESAGPWEGGANCSPIDDLLPGAKKLGTLLQAKFAITTVSGYSCRASTGSNKGDMSVHGTGRALDLMIADVEDGEPIADYLVTNAEALGVMMVIFNNSSWMSTTSGGRSGVGTYSGDSPHTDHVHVEISADKATDINNEMALPDEEATPNNVVDPLFPDTGVLPLPPPAPSCVPASAATLCAEAKATRDIECGLISDGCSGTVDCSELAGFSCAADEFCGAPKTASPNRCQKKKDGPTGELGDDFEADKNPTPLAPQVDDTTAPSGNDPNKKQFKRPGYTKTSAGCSATPSGDTSTGALPALAVALGAVLLRRRRRA